MQEECGERLTKVDPVTAQPREQGGYRPFSQMTAKMVENDPYLGSVRLISYTDEFVVSSRGKSTIYFALRYCMALGIPTPMRVEVSIEPSDIASSFAATCVSSSLKSLERYNSTVRSVACDSDVGECSFEAFACARNA